MTEVLITTFDFILRGTGVTVAVTLIALPMGCALGLFLALARVYGGKSISNCTAVYSIVIRGIPPVVLLFVLFFIVTGGINISPFWAGSVSLGIISSGYQLEIFRGAILSTGNDQMMAARSIGMSRSKAIRHIILPQALRIAIPPWSNEAATLVKDSSLVFVLGVPEILRRAQFVSARTYQPFLAFGLAALIYFLLTFFTNRILDMLETHLKIPANVVE